MDNLRVILHAVLRGIGDSWKGAYTILYLDKNIKERAMQRSPTKDHNAPNQRKEIHRESSKKNVREEEPKILKRTLQCCALNGGVFLLSLLFFEKILLPYLEYMLKILFGHSSSTGQSIWSWMQIFLHGIFSAFWVLPLFVLSKIVNSLWFQDIADSAYRYNRGRPQLISSVSKLIADILFSGLIQALFLLQSSLVSMLPIAFLGYALYLMHMCMMYSLYAFEYKWFNMGWELHRRLTFIESNWPYFIGFGLSLSVLTALPSSFIISGCIFSILFPLFIISGNEAEPVTGACDYPLQLFSPVILISNEIFNRTIRPRAVKSANARR